MPIGIATVLFLAIAQIKNLEFFDSFAHAGQGPAPEPPRFFGSSDRSVRDGDWRFSEDRGRDGCCQPPPAQIRT